MSQCFKYANSFSILVNCIAWAPWEYGLLLLAGSSDGKISLIAHAQDRWDLLQFAGHKTGVTCTSWGPYDMPKKEGQLADQVLIGITIIYSKQAKKKKRRKRENK